MSFSLCGLQPKTLDGRLERGKQAATELLMQCLARRLQATGEELVMSLVRAGPEPRRRFLLPVSRAPWVSTRQSGTGEMTDTDKVLPSELTSTSLEVDTLFDDDSALGEDRYTITTSLASSVTDFKHEHGRRYHAFDDAAYFLPNDEIEAARLDLQHYTWKVTLDGAHGRVPITDKVKTVLDVGTGTGIWAIELADAHPDVQVYGTDLSPIQPDLVPPNCQFIVDNCEHDWAFDRKFDYIHIRLLTLGMHDWPRLFQQAFDHLNPGGWIETQEVQFPIKRAESDEPKESPLLKWGEHVLEAAAKLGVDAKASEKFTEQLQEVGFVNAEKVHIHWPLGSWPKGRKNKFIGRLLYQNTVDAVPAVGTALFARALGMTKEDIDEEVKAALADMEDKSNHYYVQMRLDTAQKPETATHWIPHRE